MRFYNQIKVLCIFFNLCYISNFTSQAQDYTPFPTANAEWYASITYPIMGGGSDVFFWKEYLQGDTLINGYSYQIVRLFKVCRKYTAPHTFEVTYTTDYALNDLAIGGIRESDKKIYFYKFDYDHAIHGAGEGFENVERSFDVETEYLLYDFDVAVGDTVFHNDGYYTIILDELSPSFDRKRYEVSHSGFWYDGHIWTEGVGSDIGLFGPYFDEWDFPTFSCTIIDDVAIPNDNCNDCPEVTGITSTSGTTPFSISPTANIGHYLLTASPPYPLKNIYIYNELGQVVWKTNQVNHHQVTINVSHVPTSYLIIKATTYEGQIFTKKLLIH